MKKLVIAVLSFLFIAFSDSFCALPITFNGIGAGGEISLILPEDEHVENDGAAFGFGLKGMVEFSLGKYGTLQYVPSLALWFKHDEWKTGPDVAEVEHEERISQIFLNFLDVKYLFPIPEKYFIKPYVGLTPIIPFIAIYRYDYDRDPGEDEYYSEADPCLNMFAGIDFPVTKIFRPYAEWRFSLTDEWAMKLSGGVTIHF